MHRAASSLSSLWLFHVAVWGGMNWGEFPLLPSSTEGSSEQLLPLCCDASCSHGMS